MIDVFEFPVFVRPFNFCSVLLRSGCRGGFDRRCSGVSKVRRHGRGAVIGGGQAAKKRGGRTNGAGNFLP